VLLRSPSDAAATSSCAIVRTCAPTEVSRKPSPAPGVAQTKLAIGRSGDRWEREADRIADAVTSLVEGNGRGHARPAAGVGLRAELRRQPEDIFELEAEDLDELERDEELLVQPKETTGDAASVPPRIEARLGELGPGGRPLSSGVRALFEPHLGHDFSRVRVHTDDRADGIAHALHARAFTWGNQIGFRRGEFAPEMPAGRHLLAHELVHVVQQNAAPQVRCPYAALAAPSITASAAMVHRKDCNFYVYDSTETTAIGKAWRVGAKLRALGARGGYAIASSHTIEYMLTRLLEKFSDEGCDCVEEVQFWSHGSAGNAMSISKTDDELTAADFNIPGLETFGYIPTLEQMADPKSYIAWSKWFNSLSWRQQLLVELRHYICGRDAEIYYRSCSAFQGKIGKKFAKESARFWRSKVIGHTKLIGLTQPGQKVLRPGEEPSWSEEEGTGGTEFKKRRLKGETKPKK
jgi:hypothetical protein